MHNILGAPLFYIYLVYGSSFLIMTVLLARGIEGATSSAMISTFSVLAIFGLMHGMAEIVDWIRFIIDTLDLGDIIALKYVSQFLMVISFVFLLQFGTNLLTYRSENKTILRLIPLLLFCVYLVALFAMQVNSITSAGLIGRYCFGLAGAMVSAVALFRLGRTVKSLNNPKLDNGLITSTVGFSLYGIFGGVIVQPLAGLPIQLFRATCAVVITISTMFVLDVFRYE